MDGFGKTLFWFSEVEAKMEVPFFQRPYVWDEENWKSLVESIRTADEKRMPFIGSFILQERDEGTCWVIDGQQRITTLSIFIRALLDQKRYEIKPHVKTRLEEMVYRCVSYDSDNAIYKTRLTPSNADAESFEKVMAFEDEERNVKPQSSRIEDCYLFFRNCFDTLSAEDIKSIIEKILTKDKYFIIITLDSKDDEQAIFDTVNSLGKHLTNSDIIKNYLYQKMKSFAGDDRYLMEEVLNHYKKYWEKIFIADEFRHFWDAEVSLGRITVTNLDAFLKDFGTIKGIYVPSETGGFEGLAKEYKRYINSLTNDQLKGFSIELSEYAKNYYQMKKDFEDCDDFRISDNFTTTLLILNALDTSTFNPYLLKIYSEKGPDYEGKLFELQRFVLRRFLWKATSKNYNKCCLELLKTDNPNQYLNDYNKQTQGMNWDSYPIQVKNLRNKQGTILLFLIEMIRRNKEGEDKFSDTLLYNKSLEHIMPQKWFEHWSAVPSYALNDKKEFIQVKGEEMEANRQMMIPSLGNMTLLSSKLNTSISNESFSVKIEGKSRKKGIRDFVKSLLIANEIVKQYEVNPNWDERNIINRELSLVQELNDYYRFTDKIELTSI